MFETDKQVVIGQQGQDRIGIFTFDDRVILIVADGAGGLSGGAEAADLVVSIASADVNRLRGEQACLDCLAEADKVIARDPIAGETTGVLVVVTESMIFGASVGDSGCHLIADSVIEELTQRQMRRPFLGSGAARVVGFQRAWKGGVLLAATDGLFKYTSRERIAETIRQPGNTEVCMRLLGLVRYPSGGYPDDVGIAVCRSSVQQVC